MWDWPCILTLLLKLPERVYRWEDVILDEPTPLLTSQVALEVNNPPAFAGDLRDAAGLIPRLGSPGGGHAIHSSVLAWRIPRTEEPGGLQSIGSHGVGHD